MKVESHIRRTCHKKLVLKTNKGQRVHGPVLKSSNVKEDSVKPVAKPRYKKRSAPQVPQVVIEANTHPSPVSRQISLGKKIPAPRRPDTAPITIADDNKIMNKDSEVQGDIKETMPHVSATHKASDKSQSLKHTSVSEPPAISEISNPTEPTLEANPAPSMEEGESATYDNSTFYMNGIDSDTVEQKLSTNADSDKDVSFTTNVSSATDTDSYISELSSTAEQESIPHHPPPLSRQSTKKRKAPARPAPPHMNLDENTILQNVALRDRQPKREEINKELQFLEIRQRELEMEGVVMEKKLRDNSASELVDSVEFLLPFHVDSVEFLLRFHVDSVEFLVRFHIYSVEFLARFHVDSVEFLLYDFMFDSVEFLVRFHVDSVEFLVRFHIYSVEFLVRFHVDSVGFLVRFQVDLVEFLVRFHVDSVEFLVRFHVDSDEFLVRFHVDSVKFLVRFHVDSVKFLVRFHVD